MIKVLVLGSGSLGVYKGLSIEADVQYLSSLEQARERLILGDFDFLLGDFTTKETAWVSLVEQHLAKNQMSFYFSSDQKESFLARFDAEKGSPHFQKVELRQLYTVDPIPCDVFLMISPLKYIKLVKANESSAKEIFKRYESKGISAFYVRREDYFVLSKEIQKILLQSIKEVDEIQAPSLFDVASLQAKNVVMVKEISQNLKMDFVTLENLNQIVDSNVSFIMKSKGTLKNYLKSFMNAGPYLYGHSIMTSHIANYVALRLSWSTTKTMEKLSMAALLHDMAISDERLFKLDGLENGGTEAFSEEDLLAFRRHPVLAYNVVSQQSGVLPDVAQIILCHHEEPDGTGFPRGLNATQVSQIACLFNISHFFVSRVYGKVWNRGLIQDLSKVIFEKFNKGNYAPICEVFVKMLEEVMPLE